MAMLDLWFEIPWWVRAPFACAIIGYGGYTVLSGYQTHQQLAIDEERTQSMHDMAAERRARGQFEIGFVVTLIGVGMLAISGRSRAEKNGYRSC
jgi:hypothetical protein